MAVGREGTAKNRHFLPTAYCLLHTRMLDYPAHATKINPTLTRIVIGVSRRTGCLQRAARSSPLFNQARRAGYLRYSSCVHSRFVHALCEHAQGAVERA